MSKPGITRGVDTWKMQDNYVERLMDNAAYTSAHPDDTLVMAGPARYHTKSGNGGSFASSLLPIGMLQNFSTSQSKPTTPMMSIGSGRQYFTSGKAQTNWSMSRLFVNGRNLLRVLHTQAVQAGVNVSKLDDQVSDLSNAKAQFFTNLDSELFYVPFGLAVLFRDKVQHQVAAYYIELCMITNWSLSFSAGQNFIAEGVGGLADRIVPMGTFNDQGSATSQSAEQAKLDPTVLGLSVPPDTTVFGDIESK